MTLIDKTILITGAARRLGKAAALHCADQGANLILHYNTSETEILETKEATIKRGQKCWTVQADLNDIASIRHLIENASAFSCFDALINNASIFKSVGFMESTTKDWEKHLRVNLTAPYLLTQLFAKQYAKEEAGRVINLVDWRALRPGKDHFPYTISKAGLVAFTKAAALSLAPKIIVNAIALGAILPPEDEPDNPDILKHVPMQRWATMDEFLSTIDFLLDGPTYITGEVIHLDGGRHLV